MWWMWIVGPVWVALVFVFAAKADKRRPKEIEIWRRAMAPVDPRPVKKGAKGKPSEVGLPKRLAALPGPLQRAVDAVGSGDRLGHYELVPRLAYLSVGAASAGESSDYQTVVAKLDAPAPSFVIRPVPLVDGQFVPNTGLEFKKDPEFMDRFLVEPNVSGIASDSRRAELLVKHGKAMRKWLTRPIREALMDMPNAWLRLDGATMTLTLYGSADAEMLEQLVLTADTIFAEHGAEGGPSLFGEDESEDADDDAVPAGATV